VADRVDLAEAAQRGLDIAGVDVSARGVQGVIRDHLVARAEQAQLQAARPGIHYQDAHRPGQTGPPRRASVEASFSGGAQGHTQSRTSAVSSPTSRV
jgi:hypothetical protein